MHGALSGPCCGRLGLLNRQPDRASVCKIIIFMHPNKFSYSFASQGGTKFSSVQLNSAFVKITKDISTNVNPCSSSQSSQRPAGVTASPVREARVPVEDKDEASESMSQTTGKGTVTWLMKYTTLAKADTVQRAGQEQARPGQRGVGSASPTPAWPDPRRPTQCSLNCFGVKI